jgi:hypothetical protein
MTTCKVVEQVATGSESDMPYRVDTLQIGYLCIHTPSQDKEQDVYPRTASCPAAPDLAFLPRWATTLPCVLWHQTPPPYWGGLWCCHVSYGSRPRLRPRWASTLPLSRGSRPRHVSYGSEPHFSTGKGSGAATHPAVPYGPHTSSIKKGLASLPIQLGSRVSKACTHVPKAPDARAIMGLQDVQAGNVINASKTSGYTATVQH